MGAAPAPAPAEGVSAGVDDGRFTADSPADSPADIPGNIPADLPAAQRAAFVQLQRRFQCGLPARRLAITGATSDGALQSALHRLAGAAGGYGFTALGAAAREAERCCAAADAPGLAAALHTLYGLLDAAQVTVR
jgi:hypothetical protein